jgi:hypothetical protein
MSGGRESVEPNQDETTRRYSIVTKLVHYTSKFAIGEDERKRTLQTPVRFQPPPPASRNERRRSTLEIHKFV